MIGVNRHIFIDEKEVLKLLNANGNLVGLPFEQINLHVLENRLENDHWIKNAEFFFNNNAVLEVKVEEREPVARIFTVEGNSYYIDSAATRLPLSDKISIRVPMFTNFPSNANRLRARDSLLLTSVKNMAIFIQADSFWNAQVSQINITANRTFEMIPTIGNQTILLGRGVNIDKKFDRLYSFYKQVWSKVGIEKYSIINVQYNGQVIATRRGEEAIVIDSTKAKEALNKLLMSSKLDLSNKEKTGNKLDAQPVEKAVELDSKAVEKIVSKDQSKKSVTTERQPKAVMQKQKVNN